MRGETDKLQLIAALAYSILDSDAASKILGYTTHSIYMLGKSNISEKYFRGHPHRILKAINIEGGLDISEKEFDSACRILKQSGVAITYRADSLSSTLYLIYRSSDKRKMEKKLRLSLEKYTTPNSEKYPLLYDLLLDKFEYLINLYKIEWPEDIEKITVPINRKLASDAISDIENLTYDSLKKFVPTSDGIVSINHNHGFEIESALSSIIRDIETKNSEPDDYIFRDLIVGKLKASREILKTGAFQAEIFFILAVEPLKAIIVRYEKEIAAAVAASALSLILKHVFGLG